MFPTWLLPTWLYCPPPTPWIAKEWRRHGREKKGNWRDDTGKLERLSRNIPFFSLSKSSNHPCTSEVISTSTPSPSIPIHWEEHLFHLRGTEVTPLGKTSQALGNLDPALHSLQWAVHSGTFLGHIAGTHLYYTSQKNIVLLATACASEPCSAVLVF